MSQEAPIAVGSVIASKIPGSTLWKVCPATVNEPVHSSTVDGEMMWVCSAASAVTGLNVEPAG